MIRLTVPAVGEEEVAACAKVLRSGQLVHGDEGRLFEEELASYLKVADAVVVSSGTAALHLSLVALGIGSGDAVLVPDFTFPATANVVELTGARPVFVDVDRSTYNICLTELEQTISNWQGPEKLTAIMPVHEFGRPVDMAALMALARAYNLLVIEDAACALGANWQQRKVGGWGDCGCFSFHPRKTLTTGEGGAIVTDDRELAARLRLWRAHGMAARPDGTHFLLPGFNYRMTNFQAAIGRIQLTKLDGWIDERRELQAVYRRLLAGVPGLTLPQDCPGHSWQSFMVVLDETIGRDVIIRKLKDSGVETNLGAQCLHSLDYYAGRYPGAADRECVAAPVLYAKGLVLPLYQGLKEAEVAIVADRLSGLLKGECR